MARARCSGGRIWSNTSARSSDCRRSGRFTRGGMDGEIALNIKNGVKGKGGMPKDFKLSDHGPRRLRVETLCGLVFALSLPVDRALLRLCTRILCPDANATSCH